MINVTCSQCGAVYHSEESHIGKRLRCAHCGSLVPILPPARNIVSQQTSAPSATHVRPDPRAQAATRIKQGRNIWTAVAVFFALIAGGLILYSGQKSKTSISDRDTTRSTRQPSSGAETHPKPTVVAEEPAPTGDNTTYPDPRPTEYNSLPTGTRIERDVGTGGHGKLKVENGSDEDAVVRLVLSGSDETIRWFFVKAHGTAHVHGIPAGDYRLAFTTGLNWVDSEDAFSWHPIYSEFEHPFEFNEQRDSERIQYHSISVTLHSVPFGNVRTRTITREEFLRGHKHVGLQTSD